MAGADGLPEELFIDGGAEADLIGLSDRGVSLLNKLIGPYRRGFRPRKFVTEQVLTIPRSEVKQKKKNVPSGSENNTPD